MATSSSSGTLYKSLQLNKELHPRILDLLLSFLNRLVEVNVEQGRPTVFHTFQGGRSVISIEDYLKRIFKFIKVHPSCYLLAYVYMNRLMESIPGFTITWFTVHRLLLGTLVIASKFHDWCYRNGYYARVGGLTIVEMNRLEKHLLFCLGFRLHVTPSEFEDYCRRLESEIEEIERPVSLKINCGTSTLVEDED